MDVVLYVKLEISGGDEYWFTKPSDGIDGSAIPSLEGVSVSPAVLDPGRSIGQRETVTARFTDHLHRFDTDEYEAGTFWTKFRARYPTIQGATLRVYRGERGEAIANLEHRMYVVDKLQIGRRGATITAKDPLSLVLGTAAQAPNVNTGELTSAIDTDDTAIVLKPTGIGNIEYPASGRACIGGDEIVSFTRSGDNVTLTSRGENLNGVGQEHDADSKFQVVLEYSSDTPSAIVYDLLTNYTDVDSSWITLTDWESVDDHVGHLYSAQIAAPESVTKLLDEISEQVGMTLYWDSVTEQLRLISLAPAGGSYQVNDDNIIADSFDVTEQPDKRISQPWTYYAQRNAALKLDEESNYRRVAVDIADNSSDYGQTAIKKIHSRWIGIGSQTAAIRLNEMLLARYKVPPRTFRFELLRNGSELPRLGGGVAISHRLLVDEDGERVTVPAQIISESQEDDRVSYTAEEILYDGSADTTKLVIIDSWTRDFEMRALFDSLYSSVGDTDTVRFILNTNVIVYGYPEHGYAVRTGSWPAGVTLEFVVNGIIEGYEIGALAGRGILATRALTVVNNGAIIGQGEAGIAINGWSLVTYSGSGLLEGGLVG